jgi:hypothetical protein
MARDGLTNVVRDYLYDVRNLKVGGTVAQVMNAVNTIRAKTGEKPTDDGAVRRAMDIMASRGTIVRDDSRKPVRYYYPENKPMPPGHVSYSQRIATAGTVGQAAAQAQAANVPNRKGRLHQMLNDRIAADSGKPATPKTAKNPGPLPATIVKRPNGEEYRVRAIGDKADIDMLRMLRDNEIWSLFYGPPGTGKTALVEAAFGADVILFPGDENTTVDDLFGTWVGDGAGSWMWVDGPVITAMKNGQVIFLDDITLVNGRVLGALYPAMDGRRTIVVKTHMVDTDENGKPWADGMKHPEIVKAQPGFYIVGAHNPGTNGAILSPALSSRFHWQMEVDSDLDLAQSAGVPSQIMFLARNLQTQTKEGTISWMPQLRELFQAKKIFDVTGSLELAVSNLIGLAPEDDIEYVRNEARKIVGIADIDALRIGKQL